MFRQVINFVINGIGICFNVTKTFILDKIGNLNITYYHFIVFVIFMTITIRLIGFIKGIQEVENEKKSTYQALTEFDEYKQYQGWLKRRANKR